MKKSLQSLVILFVALSCRSPVASIPENGMYSFGKSLDGIPCRVYFFKRWGTYEHPVRPLDPISYGEALQRSGYCRVWMCESGNKEQFLLLEAIRNNLQLTPIKKNPGENTELEFFEYQKDQAGRKISGDVTLGRDRFLVSLPDSPDYLSLVNTSPGYRFRYYYESNGKLKKVKITNMEGEVKLLEY